MKYCGNCGTALPEDANVCPACGKEIRKTVTQDTQQDKGVQENDKKNKGSLWWGVLGFFVPVAGLVLFIVWLKDEPRSAKAAGIGALISVGLAILLFVLMVVSAGVLFTRPFIYY